MNPQWPYHKYPVPPTYSSQPLQQAPLNIQDGNPVSPTPYTDVLQSSAFTSASFPINVSPANIVSTNIPPPTFCPSFLSPNYLLPASHSMQLTELSSSTVKSTPPLPSESPPPLPSEPPPPLPSATPPPLPNDLPSDSFLSPRQVELTSLVSSSSRVSECCASSQTPKLTELPSLSVNSQPSLSVGLPSVISSNFIQSATVEMLPTMLTLSSPVESTEFLPPMVTKPQFHTQTDSSTLSAELLPTMSSKLTEKDDFVIAKTSVVSATSDLPPVLSQSPLSSVLNNSASTVSSLGMVSGSVAKDNTLPPASTELLPPSYSIPSSVESTKLSSIEPTESLDVLQTKSSLLSESVPIMSSRLLCTQAESTVLDESSVAVPHMLTESAPVLNQPKLFSTLNSSDSAVSNISMVSESVPSVSSVSTNINLSSASTAVLLPNFILSSPTKFSSIVPTESLIPVLTETLNEPNNTMSSKLLCEHSKSSLLAELPIASVATTCVSTDSSLLHQSKFTSASNSSTSTVSSSSLITKSVSSISSIISDISTSVPIEKLSSLSTVSSPIKLSQFCSTVLTEQLTPTITKSSSLPNQSLPNVVAKAEQDESSVPVESSITPTVSSTGSSPVLFHPTLSSTLRSSASSSMPVSTSVSFGQNKQISPICYVLVPVKFSPQSVLPDNLHSVHTEPDHTLTLHPPEGETSVLNSLNIASPISNMHIEPNCTNLHQTCKTEISSFNFPDVTSLVPEQDSTSIVKEPETPLCAPTSQPLFIKTEESAFIHFAEAMISQPFLPVNTTALPNESLQDSCLSENQDINFLKRQVIQEHNYCAIESNSEQNSQQSLQTTNNPFLATVIARDHDYCMPSKEPIPQTLSEKDMLSEGRKQQLDLAEPSLQLQTSSLTRELHLEQSSTNLNSNDDFNNEIYNSDFQKNKSNLCHQTIASKENDKSNLKILPEASSQLQTSSSFIKELNLGHSPANINTNNDSNNEIHNSNFQKNKRNLCHKTTESKKNDDSCSDITHEKENGNSNLKIKHNDPVSHLPEASSQLQTITKELNLDQSPTNLNINDDSNNEIHNSDFQKSKSNLRHKTIESKKNDDSCLQITHEKENDNSSLKIKHGDSELDLPEASSLLQMSPSFTKEFNLGHSPTNLNSNKDSNNEIHNSDFKINESNLSHKTIQSKKNDDLCLEITHEKENGNSNLKIKCGDSDLEIKDEKSIANVDKGINHDKNSGEEIKHMKSQSEIFYSNKQSNDINSNNKEFGIDFIDQQNRDFNKKSLNSNFSENETDKLDLMTESYKAKHTHSTVKNVEKSILPKLSFDVCSNLKYDSCNEHIQKSSSTSQKNKNDESMEHNKIEKCDDKAKGTDADKAKGTDAEFSTKISDSGENIFFKKKALNKQDSCANKNYDNDTCKDIGISLSTGDITDINLSNSSENSYLEKEKEVNSSMNDSCQNDPYKEDICNSSRTGDTLHDKISAFFKNKDCSDSTKDTGLKLDDNNDIELDLKSDNFKTGISYSNKNLNSKDNCTKESYENVISITANDYDNSQHKIKNRDCTYKKSIENELSIMNDYDNNTQSEIKKLALSNKESNLLSTGDAVLSSGYASDNEVSSLSLNKNIPDSNKDTGLNVDSHKEHCINNSSVNCEVIFSDFKSSEPCNNQNSSNQNDKNAEFKIENSDIDLNLRSDNFKPVISNCNENLSSKDNSDKESNDNLTSTSKNDYFDSQQKIKKSVSANKKTIENGLSIIQNDYNDDSQHEIENSVSSNKEPNENALSFIKNDYDDDSQHEMEHSFSSNKESSENALSIIKNDYDDSLHDTEDSDCNNKESRENVTSAIKNDDSQYEIKTPDYNEQKFDFHKEIEKSVESIFAKNDCHEAADPYYNQNVIDQYSKDVEIPKFDSYNSKLRDSYKEFDSIWEKSASIENLSNETENFKKKQHGDFVDDKRKKHRRHRKRKHINSVGNHEIGDHSHLSETHQKREHSHSAESSRIKEIGSSHVSHRQREHSHLSRSRKTSEHHHSVKSPRKSKKSSPHLYKSPSKHRSGSRKHSSHLKKTMNEQDDRLLQTAKSCYFNSRSSENIKNSNSLRTISPESINNYNTYYIKTPEDIKNYDSHHIRTHESVKDVSSYRTISPESIRSSYHERSRSLESLKSNSTRKSRSPKSIQRLHDRYYNKSSRVSEVFSDTIKDPNKHVDCSKQRLQTADIDDSHKRRQHEETKKMRRLHRSRHKRHKLKDLPPEIIKNDGRSVNREKSFNDKHADNRDLEYNIMHNKERMQLVDKYSISKEGSRSVGREDILRNKKGIKSVSREHVSKSKKRLQSKSKDDIPRSKETVQSTSRDSISRSKDRLQSVGRDERLQSVTRDIIPRSKERLQSVSRDDIARKERLQSVSRDDIYKKERIRSVSRDHTSRSKERLYSINRDDIHRSKERLQSVSRDDISKSKERLQSVNRDDVLRSKERLQSVNRDDVPRSKERLQSISRDDISRSKGKFQSVSRDNISRNKYRLQSIRRSNLFKSKSRLNNDNLKMRRQCRSRRRSSTPKDLPCLSLKAYKYVCSTAASDYYYSLEKDSKEVTAKDALKALHEKFRHELLERAERIRASKPRYEPPKRKTKLRKPKPPKTDSNSDSSSSSEKSSSEEEDTSMEELERKKKHPYRLHLELWFNDPKEMNDGPLCRCSAKARRAGIRHGIYVGEDHLPLCNPLSNNVDRLYHYRITMTPHTNFLTKNPTTIYHNGVSYRFEGFSMFSHSKLPPLPNCKVIRFNYEYTIVYAEEEFPKNFTIQGLELFSNYLLVEILELVDLNWKAHNDPDGCPRFHFMPRFSRELKDGGKELLSHCYVLDYLLKQNQILIDEKKLSKVLSLNNLDWQDLADEVKGMIITCPGMKPSSIRVDQLDREQCVSDKEEFPVIVHFGVRPPQLSYAGNPHYQKAWRDYVKYRHLLANKPKVRYADRHKLLQKEVRLQEMRMENDLKRDVTVVISSKNFYKTGIMSDVVQHAMLLPVLVCHLRFHQSLSHLENKLGYKFQDRFLLQLALTHPSYRENFGTNPDHARNSLTNCGLRQPQYGDRRIHYMNTRKRGINTLINIMSRFGSRKETLSRINHNERLEFLGDAVVEFLSSIHLFYMFPDLEEGGLATYRAAIVQNQHLAVLSKKLELDRFMLYAHGSDLCHDLELRHAMANCFEALMGALFLDNGIEIADKVFSKTLFSEPELLEVWMNFSPHPLQEQEPGGDRKWIESVPLLQKLHKFEETIGIEFNHIRLLARALTHRSLGYNNLTLGSNQRLEFLGDTVLQLVASEYLYKFFPEHHEGHLSLLRSSLVNNRTQAVVCADLGMVDYAIYPYDKVELKPKDKADLLEAFLGALYVDKDLGYCRKFCEVCFFPRLQDFIMNQDWNDPKSKLQQCCLTLRSMDGGEPDIPTYKVIECKGPTNTRVYSVAVYFQGNRLAVGSGHSIQQAEMDAASNALNMSKDLFPQLRHQRRAIERSLKKRPLNKNKFSQKNDKEKISDKNKHPPQKEKTIGKSKPLPKKDREKLFGIIKHSPRKYKERMFGKIKESPKKDKERTVGKSNPSPKKHKEKISEKNKNLPKKYRVKISDKSKLLLTKGKEKHSTKDKGKTSDESKQSLMKDELKTSSNSKYSPTKDEEKSWGKSKHSSTKEEQKICDSSKHSQIKDIGKTSDKNKHSPTKDKENASNSKHSQIKEKSFDNSKCSSTKDKKTCDKNKHLSTKYENTPDINTHLSTEDEVKNL